MELDPAIAAHYELGFEGARLASGAGLLEALRTRVLLARYLPRAPAIVIDAGGAEGVYACPLAADGYAVHLVDPVSRHVDAALAASAQARTPLASARVGDARALPFEDDVADAVLMLGPLYHLIDAGDRARALQEAHRVLRPGGVVIVAAISRFASTIDGIRSGFIHDPRFAQTVEETLRSGVHRNPDVSGHPQWFTLAYFHTAEELRREVSQAGFGGVRVVAVEGLAAFCDDLTDDLADPDRRAALLRSIELTESEPTVIGATSHLIATGVAGAA